MYTGYVFGEEKLLPTGLCVKRYLGARLFNGAEDTLKLTPAAPEMLLRGLAHGEGFSCAHGPALYFWYISRA